MSDDTAPGGHSAEQRTTDPERLLEEQADRASEQGDALAKAVDRHREDFGLPDEPADGEQVDDS